MGLKNVLENGLSKAEVRAILALTCVTGLVALTFGVCAFVPEMRELAFTTLANIAFTVIGYYFGIKKSQEG